MLIAENFESLLTGGHPNSLGKTVDVVEIILKDQSKFQELFMCYFSSDEVVRLRVSNAMKRICKVNPKWLVPYLNRLIVEISKINQASTQWTLAQLFLLLEQDMTSTQKAQAVEIMKANLISSDDWIVQNCTIDTLSKWALHDQDLRLWLVPKLANFAQSPRKSVASRANKKLLLLG